MPESPYASHEPPASPSPAVPVAIPLSITPPLAQQQLHKAPPQIHSLTPALKYIEHATPDLTLAGSARVKISSSSFLPPNPLVLPPSPDV